MTTIETIIALKSVVCLLLLWFFVFVLWKDYCLDVFRERIFTLRDELFLAASRGEIGFNDPAYRMFRERLNISLRYAHEFTLSKLCVALAFPMFSINEGLAWEEHMKPLPEETRALLVRYRIMFVSNVLRYMLLRSYLLSVLLLLAYTGTRVVGGFNDLTKRYILSKATPAVEKIESEVFEEDDRHRNPTVPVGV
jgi:hypothetical protein